MESQAPNYPSQQARATELGDKIEEVRNQRQEQLKQYGQVAIETPQFDASGVMLTPKEQKTELAYRQEHGGRSSNETATAH